MGNKVKLFRLVATIHGIQVDAFDATETKLLFKIEPGQDTKRSQLKKSALGTICNRAVSDNPEWATFNTWCLPEMVDKTRARLAMAMDGHFQNQEQMHRQLAMRWMKAHESYQMTLTRELILAAGSDHPAAAEYPTQIVHEAEGI